jgi:hypothetical protein
MRQPWPHKRKIKRASTPPALPPTDSTRSEDDSLFYIPFGEEEDDDDDDEPRLPSQQSSSKQSRLTRTTDTQSLVASSQEKQKYRNDAIAVLGEFFMGEPAAETSSSDSPTSVILSKPSLSSEVKKDMIGHHDHDMEALCSGAPKEEEGAPHQFAKLTKNDRAYSLPVECMNRTTTPTLTLTLTKPPSLKKISSIGKFPTSRSESSFKRSVSFGKLGVRQYSVEISDHPSCSYGPPVQLGWDFKEKEAIPLESYEEGRHPRREIGDLVLSYYDRRFMLLKQAGYSKREVKEAVKEVERVKRERMVTDMFLPVSPVEETIVSVVDSVKGFFQRQADV